MLTRTISLGCLDLTVDIQSGGDTQESLSRSTSSPSLDVLFSVSSSARKPAVVNDAAVCESNSPAPTAGKPYLRLHVASPPRTLCTLLIFLINLIPLVTCASFFRFGAYRASPSVRVQSTVTTSSSGATPAPRRLAIPQVAIAWPSGFTGAWPEHRELLSRQSIALQEKSKEIAKSVHAVAASRQSIALQEKSKSIAKSMHAVAQTKLDKLRAQMAIVDAQHNHGCGNVPVLGAHQPESTVNVPNMIVGAAAIAAHLPQLLEDASDSTGVEPGVEPDSVISTTEHMARAPGPSSAPSASAQLDSSRLPPGFSLGIALRTAELCGFAYHSCDGKGKEGAETHVPRLVADLQASGLTLVREIESTRLDTYALIARSETAVYIVFRGSATLKNLRIDLQYHVADARTMDEYASEASMHLPPGLEVHSGFLDAWRSLRAEIIETFEAICREERERSSSARSPLRLVVSGHSMGGAMAMFASLELASRMRKREWHPFTRGHFTYTFAAPRLGNAKVARLFDLAFPEPRQLWALQRSNDAVPHLPFAAWGFKHPHGVAYLDPPGSAEEAAADDDASEEPKQFDLWARAPEGTPPSIAGSGDRGDDVVTLRPFAGKPHHWASYHHIFAYLEPLQNMLHVYYPEPLSSSEYGATSGGPTYAA